MVDAEEQIAFPICTRWGGEDLGSTIGERWEATRFDASWLERGNRDRLHMADAIEVSGMWSVLPEIHASVTAALRPLVDELWSHYSTSIDRAARSTSL